MTTGAESTEPLATIAGFTARSLSQRQPRTGVAYEARDSDGRQVALRILAPGEAGDPARFLADAEALAQVDHDAIPRVLAVGETRDGVYVVTELVEGRSLDQLIAADGGLPPMRAIRLLSDAADALTAAHDAGVLHRALRPGSILLVEHPLERTLLVDFALGSPPDPGDSEGAAYVSPEQVVGAPLAPASDVYSFACVMFETVTGAPPFLGESPDEVRRARLDGPPPRASELRPGLPAELDELLARGMAEDPAMRPSAVELVDAAARGLMAASGDTAPAETAAAPVPQAQPEETPAAAEEPEDFHWTPAAKAAAVVPAAATPAAVHAPPREAPRKRRRLTTATLPLAVALVLVGAAALAGWLVGDRSEDDGGATRLSSSAFALELPAGWVKSDPPRELGAASLRDAVAGRGAGGELVIGSADGVLPQRLVTRVGRGGEGPESVRLGTAEGYRWRGLRERGKRRELTLFALPAADGIVAIACRGAARPRSACERAAGSVDVGDSVPGTLAALTRWAAGVDKAIGQLNRRRAAYRADLRRARSRSGQARAAARLGRSHAGAARGVRRLDGPPNVSRAQSSLVTALTKVEVAYQRLARAARRGSSRSFRKQRRSIADRERALQSVLRGF